MSDTPIVIDYTFREMNEILSLVPSITQMQPTEYGIFIGMIVGTILGALYIIPVFLQWLYRLRDKKAKQDKQRSVRNFLLLKELESEIEKEIEAESLQDMQQQ